MQHTFLLVLVKPLVLGLFAVLVIGIMVILDRLIPEGRVKRFLYKQR